MLDFSINGDLSGIAGWTEQLRGWLPDMQGLAVVVSDALIAENRRARDAGEDGQGNQLVRVKESTVKRRRRAGYPEPNAVPFLPSGPSSRINDLSVQTETEPGRLTVRAYWAAAPWLKYHLEDWIHRPARDVRGLTPEFQKWLGDILSEYVRLRIEEAIHGGELAPPESFLPDNIRG